jgi:hypothetical protein
MTTDIAAFQAATGETFATYERLAKKLGPDQAWEKMLEGFPQRQKQRMTPFLSLPTLVEGFTRSIPFFERIGMKMAVVDISNGGTDAVLEIQRTCPYLQACKEHGLETPCHVICEMDIEATRRAFPEMKGTILARQAFGDCVCIFRYQRPAK